MFLSNKASPLLAMLAVAAVPSTCVAASIMQTFSGPLPTTISGTLPDQGTALEQTFTLTQPSLLTISTSSFADGGFQPNLFLFDGMGNFITSGIAGTSPLGMADAKGLILDGFLQASLPAGMFTLALTDVLLNQSLTATNLSDGFTDNFGSGTTFTDVMGNMRTGDFEFTLGVQAIPEPSTFGVAIAALSCLAWRVRASRRNRIQNS